jgi:hypothetical protein
MGKSIGIDSHDEERRSLCSTSLVATCERERERERESALSSILQTEFAKFGVGVHITG